ncbi:MAG: hypothetical protein ACP5GC_07640 [Thiomonas sp.]
MDDATINPVGAYDPVSRLPEGGGRGRQEPSGGKPPAKRPAAPAPAAPAADSGPADLPDPDTPRGRHIDDRA